ncbi:MAG TPA: DUF2079 domain-containing protein [Ktedonobacteraceae bacterium]|jgi:uncharacterized membrane protein|nr:DUF2079 domain-containing protein [Ktedonobacteraceae bacterium]
MAINHHNLMKYIKALTMRLAQVCNQRRIAWGLLIMFMLIYAVDMSRQAVLRYETFQATAFDLGNMDQVLWNTIHGRLFQFTNQAIDYYGPPTRLAIHFEPIILPLSLLYLFHADPRILLVFQTLVLVIGAIPVFLLTRKYLPGWPLLAAIMAGAYLITPGLLGLNIFDFHPVALATPLLLYAVLALEYKRYTWFIICCILAAACKEDVPLAVAGLGILVVWKYKLPRLGAVLIIGGILWSFIAFKVIIPHFYPGNQANNFWYRYEELGSSPGAAIENILLHPWILFTTFISLDRIYYMFGLVRSTGFLALLAPEWLIPALPSLAVNLLSTDPLLYSGVYHYNAVIIPFVMIASLHGIQRFIAIWQGWRAREQASSLEPAGESNAPQNGRGKVRIDRARRHLYPLRNRTGESYRIGTTTSAMNRLSTGVALGRAIPIYASARTYIPALSQRIASTLQARLIQLTLPRWRQTQWQRFSTQMQPIATAISIARLQWVLVTWIILMAMLNYLIIMPTLNSFWPDHTPGNREQQIQQLLDMIPPDASVSASDDLNPHLSERQLLAVFPSVCLDSTCTHTVEYVIVDLNSLTIENRAAATSELNALSRQFRLVARKAGVELFVRRSD